MGDALEAPLRVALGHPVCGIGLPESLGGVLTDGFQQPEADPEWTGLDREHRLFDQVLEQVIDLGAVEDLVSDHAAGIGEVERAANTDSRWKSLCWAGASRS